jgi:hypothetical protein
VVDRWVVGHLHAHGAQDLISRYNTAEVMFDEYTGSGLSATHGGEFPGWPGFAHRMGVEGRMVYHAGYLDPARSAVTARCTAAAAWVSPASSPAGA